jgi:hypothetical protein
LHPNTYCNLTLPQRLDIPVRRTKDTNPYFYGFLRRTFVIKKDQNLKPVQVEIVSPSFLLKKKIGSTDVLLDYKICDTSNNSNSLLHTLLNFSNITSLSVSDIDITVPIFPYDEEDEIYKLLEVLLFEYGYTFDFNEIGQFVLYELFPTDLTTTNLFNGTNILKSLVQTKKEEERTKIKVQFKEIEELTDVVIFSDSTNAGSGNSCNIEVLADSYFGKSDIADDWYAEYSIDGKGILSAVNATLAIVKDTNITVETFTPSVKDALLSIKRVLYSMSIEPVSSITIRLSSEGSHLIILKSSTL